MANEKTGTLADLVTFAKPGAPRYHVRSVGSDVTPTVFDTWANRRDAERQITEKEALNPGVSFEIVDLQA